MAQPPKKNATYDDLHGIPENTIGEIIDGKLTVTPRPSKQHVYAASVLEIELGAPYQFGRGGGPGGRVILVKPEIKLGENIVVPDLAGWKKERFPGTETTNWVSASPDWVCEVLSPGTLRTDKIKKMPFYGRHGVQHLWFLDPAAKTLDVFRLESDKWVVAGLFVEDDKVRAEPFQEIEIDLNNLWLDRLE
jgi:Uma2 family endonuclease